MKISVILASYNEANVIGKLIDDIDKVLKNFNHEIILTDDASKDETALIARKKGVTVIENKVNIGQCKSIRKAIKLAKGNIIVMMDSDYEHDPKYIPELIEKLGSCDIVIGQRREIPRISEKILSLFIGWKIGIKDTICGFRAVKADVFDKVEYDEEQTFGSSFLLRCVKNNYKIGTVEIKYKKREGTPRLGGTIRANLKILSVIPKIFNLLW